jgi:hypothetical protein
MDASSSSEERNVKPGLRPEELVPYVREYLGLMEDKKVLDAEVKRRQAEYRKSRDALLQRLKPLEKRLHKVEDVLKQTIINEKLPGIKYKHYIFTIEEKAVYKHNVDKIVEALNTNPIEHFSHDKKTLAKIIADAVKKKARDNSDEVRKNHENMGLRIRVLPS